MEARHNHVLFSARGPWLLWPLLALVAIACAAALFRGAAAAARAVPFLLLLLWFSSQVVAVVLGDGFVAFEQHLVGARFALDLLIALSLVEVARLALGLARPASRSSPATAGGAAERDGPGRPAPHRVPAARPDI